MSSNEKDKSPQSSLLSKWKSRKKKTGVTTAISKRPEGSEVTPSNGQQRLWLLQKLYPDNPFYQYAHRYHLKGELDVNVLLRSFQQVVSRQQILNTNYLEKEGIVQMQSQPDRAVSFEERDLSRLSKEEQQEELVKITKGVATNTFDLNKDSLLRLCLVKLSDTEHVLILSIHHIIGDRESLLILNEELWKSYQAFQQNETPVFPELSIQYDDYAYWQKEQKTAEKDLNYWLDHLSGELPLLSLPFKNQRPKQPSFQGRTISRLLSSDLSNQIQDAAKEMATTPYVLLLAAFKILLFRYTQQKDILVGSPFANRDKVALEKLIGFFNETLVLRTQLSEDWSFKELVAALKITTLKALEHKQVPFEELVRELQPERQGSANPIFQVMFLYNKTATINQSPPDLQIKESTIDIGVSKFDLTLFVTEQAEGLEMAMEFALDLFDEPFVATMLQHLENILVGILKEPNQRIDQLSILSEEERKMILEDWNDTSLELPDYKAIHQLIEEVATRRPDQIAVVFGKEQITYEELNEQATSLAKILLENDLGKNAAIGLYVPRSVAMVVGIVGILKAGAAYLPLDPDYPEERIQYMLDDAEVSYVVTSEQLKKQINFTDTTLLTIEEAHTKQYTYKVDFPIIDKVQMAYLIYTSGSTGKPKGVPISHGNVLHSTLARFKFYPENPSAFLLLSSFSFDSSVVGIFWTLCSGGKLVLPPQRIEQDVELLSTLIAKEEVTHTLLLPSLYAAILNHAPAEKLQSLRTIMVAGEACPLSLIDTHFETLPRATLYNEYGPTEASVWCVAHRVSPKDRVFTPIGKAIPNTTAYVLDDQMQPVPVGVAGELYIGGLGLSKGYLNRPALTEERFLALPFGEKERVYKTGDLARFHEKGLLEFLGRADHQVKIRGFRVELEEIQKVILQQAEIAEALVLVQDSENENGKQQRLIAYISLVSEVEEGSTIKEIRNNLKAQLPAYMVPAVFVPLSSFPRLPNGKVNRHKLPSPDTQLLKDDNVFDAPESNLEKELCTIWESVLNVKPIGVNDNFFAVGGDSILSIQVVAKARAAGIVLLPTQLFEYQTVASLARSIENNNGSDQAVLSSNDAKHTPLENLYSYGLTNLQQAFLFNSKREEEDQGQLQLEFTLRGEIDIPIFQEAWQQSAQRHDIMRAFVKTEDGKTSTQEIAKETILPWEINDWSQKAEEAQKEALLLYKQKDQQQKLNLSEAPTSRMAIFKLAKDKYLLLWTCHHIFLDGWSCGIVLKEALAFYAASEQKQNLNLAPIPNYLSFLDWKSKQDQSDALAFWEKELVDFDRPLLFPPSSKGEVGSSNFADELLVLDEEKSSALRTYCQKNQITLSTLFQGLWAMLLNRYFQTTDVVYGLTVSGRFSNFENIASISGLFMNTIPNRFDFNQKIKLGDWFRTIQKEQGRKSQYEEVPLDEIRALVNWPAHTEMFDSLFVFGNFLKDGLQVGPLEVEDFEGGFSSVYPLTVRVNPTAAIQVNWRYDKTRLSTTVMDWFRETFEELSVNMSQANDEDMLYYISRSFEIPYERVETQLIDHSIKQESYIPPRTAEEAALCELWQQLFNMEKIGITDHFFDLGGNSLMAIQLFSKMEKELGVVLPPSTLFEYPTIEKMVQFIQGDQKAGSASSVLVPLRATGAKPPLFCLHGGGAHVFFYKGLSKCLPEDQPVYSLQPPGLDGISERHETIGEMAAHYIKEIESVQQEGPYHILGTCFSNAVTLEMANQLSEKGKEVAKLFIIDSAPVHLFGDDPAGKSKTLVRFYDMLQRGDFSRIKSKIIRRFKKPATATAVAERQVESESEKNLRLTIDSLNMLYANYNWAPYLGEINFIRSSEFANRVDKKYHVTQWQKLAKGGLEVHEVKGHHKTLFEEPEVKGLAEKIADSLGMQH